ncbi:hypothetical protein ACH5RR_028322 [Cinchona calisaya]|uniref:F-box domain-containing protein n=1 Tax=Cinchona calisaya TaxID=153742 RepID=A0ABD2YPT9_9GENT
MELEIPTDILREILRRLPVKSLIRFRCVCRSWCAFITSPEFIALHLSRRYHADDTNILIMLFIQETKKYVLSFHSNNESLDTIAPDLEVPIFHDFGTAGLLGPSNGIVCIATRKDICLFNPATRKFRRLPDCPFGCPQDFFRCSEHSGFGYDPITNDYKVIRLVMLWHLEDRHTYAFRAEIYNLSTNAWRELDNIYREHLSNASVSISFKGSLHWSVLDCVLSFHLNSEEFTEIEYPPSYVFTRPGVHNLAVLDESLALIICIPDDDYDIHRSIDVWVMKEYGVQGYWIKRFSIASLPNINFPLSFRNNNEEEELFIESKDGQLISCVLSNCQEFRKYNVREPSSCVVGIRPESVLNVVTYRESLIPIQE